MQTADICDFLSPNIKKQANLRLPLNVQKLKVFQLQEGFAPLDQGLCRFAYAPLILLHYLIPFMTFVR